jgi:hypothetical protein
MTDTDTACAAIDVLAAQLKALVRKGRARGSVTINFGPGSVGVSELKILADATAGHRFPVEALTALG